MALNVNDDNGSLKPNSSDAIKIDTGDFTEGANTADRAQSDDGKTLGFDMGTFITMNSMGAGELTKKVADSLAEVYKDTNNTYEAKVTILDQQKYTGLRYNTVVVSTEDKGKVSYYMLVLEASDRKPLMAKEFLSELHLQAKNQSKGGYGQAYVTSDAIDKNLNDFVLMALQVEYGGKREFINVDSMVIPFNYENITTASMIDIAMTAYNACSIELGKLNGVYNDLNLTTAIQNGMELKIETNQFPQTYKDYTDRPIRGDFATSLLMTTGRSNSYSLNTKEGRIMLCQVTGFIDAVPEVVPVPNMQQNSLMDPPIRFRPNIIIDSVKVKYPTIGYTLLALASSMVMLNPNVYYGCLTPKDNMENHDHGVLNIIAKLENNPDGGEPYNLSDPANTTSDIYAYLQKIYTLDPIVSMDIDVYGPETHYTSVFSLAASPITSNISADMKLAAAQDIIDTAHWLTGGIFPANFNANEIFAVDAVVIPTGRFIDNSGKDRDIREIDYVSLAKITNGDIDIMNRWATSSFPAPGMDSFSAKVEILADVIPNAEINGKADRIVFSGGFLNELMRACTQAGLVANYEPTVVLTQNANIASFSNVLQNASVNAANGGFSPFNGNNGSNFRTRHTTSGTFRNW